MEKVLKDLGELQGGLEALINELNFANDSAELCTNFTKDVFDLADKYRIDKAQAFINIAQAINDFASVIKIEGVDFFKF
jgi:hypothetical protein